MFFRSYAYSYMKSYLLFALLLIVLGYKYSYKFYAGTGILVMLFIIFFYRRPYQNNYKDDNALFSPCFGRIKEIRDGPNDSLFISIYIGLTDPHVQYVPYSGIIKQKLYKKGSFYPAFMEKSKYNEKIIYNIQTNRGIITLAQIGGVFARNIESFVKQGQTVNQNDELGLIGIAGSRCDLFIPKSSKFNILVKKGDNVDNTTKIVQFF